MSESFIYGFWRQYGERGVSLIMEYYVKHEITSANVRCLNTNSLIKKLSREYKDNLREYLIRCDYEYKFSFGKAIRHAVEWYNSNLCRRFRKDFYNGKKCFRFNYDNRRIPDLLFHGTAYELSWDIRLNGLCPCGEDKKVYLTDNIFAAYFFAYNKVYNKAKKNPYPIVLIVDMKDLKYDLEAKPEFYAKKDYGDMTLALFPHMQFEYPRTIDAQRLVGDFVPPTGPQNLSMLITILENVPDLTFEEQKEIEYMQKLLEPSHE